MSFLSFRARTAFLREAISHRTGSRWACEFPLGTRWPSGLTTCFSLWICPPGGRATTLSVCHWRGRFGRSAQSPRLRHPAFRRLADWGCGGARLTAVGGLEEVQAGGAVLGIALELVFDVGGQTVAGAAFDNFDRTTAVFAAELGVVIFEGDGDGLDLPEGLVAAGCADAKALHFALVEFFPFDCHETPR